MSDIRKFNVVKRSGKEYTVELDFSAAIPKEPFFESRMAIYGQLEAAEDVRANLENQLHVAEHNFARFKSNAFIKKKTEGSGKAPSDKMAENHYRIHPDYEKHVQQIGQLTDDLLVVKGFIRRLYKADEAYNCAIRNVKDRDRVFAARATSSNN